MLHNAPSTSSDLLRNNGAFATTKKKRRPAGTPDPEAEVVALSPKTLLESDRYVCEICNQGFQRDQNLQMHRRRHKVPWQLLKRSSADDEQGGSKAAAKKVYVCPEPSCLHHDPRHALGDLVGIKKHFRRKHSTHKQWVCDKCSKAYAVQSDYKAHLKTCGTRGHSCDCGRVFSRVESFIEHQDVCTIRHLNPDDHHHHQLVKMNGNNNNNNSSRTEESSSSAASTEIPYSTHHHHQSMMKLPPPPPPDETLNFLNQDAANSHQTHLLDLSIGLGLGGEMMGNNKFKSSSSSSAIMLREYANEQLTLAAAEKAYAEEARQQARKQVEIAELEFANAQKMRLQAQAELERAQHLLNQQQAMNNIHNSSSTLITQITCPACNITSSYHNPAPTSINLNHDDSSSLAISYMSSPTTDAD